jgi:hypothetical protein
MTLSISNHRLSWAGCSREEYEEVIKEDGQNGAKLDWSS